MSSPTHSRTIICSVVFLDVVGYSQMSVDKQQRVKTAFNEVVTATISRIPPDERYVLDTGDGAALCFLGDPEDAVFVAIDMGTGFRDALQGEAPRPALRTGIHLGPVRMVQDVNRHTNLIGDGINVGQRIMSFSEPDQILVSRSYFEVVGVLSSRHAALFRYEGVRVDKHVREHSVYEVDVSADDIGRVEMVEEVTHTLHLDSARRDALQADLTRLIGPLAEVLVRRAEASSRSEPQFLATLAVAVPEGGERDAFVARWRAADETATPGQPAAPTLPVPRLTSRDWTDGELAPVEAALARQIGPLAAMIVPKTARRCQSLDELIDALAGEIHEPVRQAQFRTDAHHASGH